MLLLGVSGIAGGERSACVSYFQHVLIKAGNNLPFFFFLTLIKLPGSKSTSGFLSTCAICPYLSCFFPILSTRGSSRFKNGNETLGFFYLHLFLASNHGNATYTVHHKFP